ncbi:hypothetical protein CK507_15675 [Pseudomonas sp. WN033]|nr:hypothetical protein CK507_15675 [Pseudomonas sp. WN033]
MKIKLAIALAITALLAGCSSPEDKIRGQFLSGCANSGADRAFCNCVFDRLVNQFGMEYMQRMSRAGMPPREFMEAGMKAGMACNRL